MVPVLIIHGHYTCTYELVYLSVHKFSYTLNLAILYNDEISTYYSDLMEFVN